VNVIELEHVAKRYRRPAGGRTRSLRALAERVGTVEHWALQDVSFTVARGESVALMGTNGSGKSTLLRVIAGTTRATKGTVCVRGNISGLLTLGDGLQPLLSAEENAITAAVLSGLTVAEARRRLPEITAFAELGDVMDQPLRTFSDGMRLRLAFAVSVHVEPELLLIDEILAVGDLRFQERCLTHLEHLRDAGTTLVLASHITAHIERLCGRAVWLADGRVREVGDTAMVTERYVDSLRVAETAAAPAGQATFRLGDRRVVIAGVRLLNRRDQPVTTVTPGSAITVEIEYDAHEPVDDPILVVSAHTAEDGIRCFDLNTEIDGVTVGRLDGPGRLSLQLDRLDLAHGRYCLDVGLYSSDWSSPHDYQWEALAFEVVGIRSSAPLAPPHRWSAS
jgi:lipopolysaccharide transport system ATP-binding protein